MSLFAYAAELERANIPFAIANIIETSGSTPRHQGQMLIQLSGETQGTIGGGMIERYVIEQALEALAEGKPRTVRGRMTRHGNDAMGMDCGGAMQVHIAIHGQQPKLFLIGGGHVNRAIAHNAARLGFHVIVADAHEASLAEHYFPAGTRRVLGETMADAIGQFATEIDAKSYVVIATNHQDREAISLLARHQTRYTGLLASRRKVQTLLNALREQGISEQRVNAIHTPVGLDLGAETPEEIAISVLAELLMIRNGTSGSSMKVRLSQQQRKRVVIRGAGDIATGVAVRLYNAGFQVIHCELPKPTVIRRTVSFAEAIYSQACEVEGIQAQKAQTASEALKLAEQGVIPVLIDPDCHALHELQPFFVIDAILAKKNMGTQRNMAPITIALGPGFTAGKDCDAVIETNRGHQLGRVIYQGEAQANTGEPGNIGGYSHQRVLRAPCAGRMHNRVALGDLVQEGDLIALIDDTPIHAPLNGMVRGLLQDSLAVYAGMKVGDIDPRGAQADHLTVSDKARAIAGSVLEVMLHLA